MGSSWETSDRETNERARNGVRPDLIGWKMICAAFEITLNTARQWERDGMPVISFGTTHVAAYSDRIRAWAFTRRTRAA